MKAYVAREAGGPEVLRLQDLDAPVAGDGEVRIVVKAFGVNRLDLYVRSGAWGAIGAPHQLGIEAVGEISEDRTGTLPKGTRVATYAEQIVVRASHVVPLGNAALDWATLGALPEAFLTAWAGFHKGIHPQVGEEILIVARHPRSVSRP